MRILICAHDCSPIRGSECGVGWGWVRAIAKRHDVWVLTATHFRDEIEKELDLCPELREHLRFCYVARFAREAVLLARTIWPPIYLASYRYQWQRAALRAARRLHAEIGFDVVHQLTYVGFRVPGYLSKLGLPLVWGPIGGLEQTPWRLFGGLGRRGAIHFACRNMWNHFDKRFAGSPRRAMMEATALISATTTIRAEIQKFYGRDSVVLAEVGLPPTTAAKPIGRTMSEALRLAWCGNHDPGKALPVLLRALARLPSRIAWELEIFGSGVCTEAWKRESLHLGLERRCHWRGQVPRLDFLAGLGNAHVFAVSSLHDLTSTVVVEALASGLPVVCPDLYGFRDAVTSECGIRVDTKTLEQLETGLSEAIMFLHDDEQSRQRMGWAALKQATNYCWENKSDALDKIYMEVRDCHSVARCY